MPSTDSRKAAKARALAALDLISDREEAAINRGISEDSETMEMTADVFKRVKPGPVAPVQRKKAG